MSCKFCGRNDKLKHVHNMQDKQCQSCGGFQNLKYQKVSHLGHLWYDILPINGTKRRLCRVSWLGELRKRGSVVVCIDYPTNGLIGG